MPVFRNRSKSDAQTEYTASIRFLDDKEQMQLSFKKDTLGQWLFDRVCENLNLVEKDYFGLRYVDADNQRHWLDPLKTVFKQLKGLSKMVLCFRVKFYPEDPMKLHEEITRYYLFLQLRRDLQHGRLLCPHDDSIQLAAYIIQSEVGDYHPQDNPQGYVSDFKMLPKQTPKHDEKIMEIHKTLVGVVPSDCEAEFLKKAASMDTYGVDPHQVKDQRGDPLYLGVTHLGIMTFRGSRRTQLFKWNQIRRIAYEGKMFIINHSSSEDEDVANSKKKHQVVAFRCNTAPAAKYLWRCAVEQQLFFTLSTASAAPKIRSGGGLFTRGSRFRFSGRSQKEAYEASENIRRTEPPFARTSSLPNFGKKNHNNDNNKSNTLSDTYREGDQHSQTTAMETAIKAAVDVPNLLGHNAVATSLSSSNTDAMTETGPKVTAPLAQIEAYEEQQQQQTALKTASTPSHEQSIYPKENGQAMMERPGVLETSIDESTSAYEPNQTLDDSDDGDDDDAKRPDLDEQILKLEEELISPQFQKDLNVAQPPTQSQAKSSKSPDSKKGSKGSSCVKTTFFSAFAALLIASGLFYVVFFSPLQSHPVASSMREQLTFLEPVRDVVQQRVDQAMSYLNK